MAVIISEIISPADSSDEEIISAALKKAGINKDGVIRAGVHKTSIDARKRNNIRRVSSVWAETSEENENRLLNKAFITKVRHTEFKPVIGKTPQNGKIAVVGFGPAGMFSALTLAEYGYRPIVFERGENADDRIKTVSGFWKNGKFSPESNVQFGEGGAGTFSDGKLTTRIHDPLCRYVLEKFAEFGAPKSILTKSKPHVGTDNLRFIVKNIRERIISLGGEVRFNSRVSGFNVKNGKLSSLTVNGSEEIPVCAAVLAVGHSARDTFSALLSENITLEPKPFSVGARIEHTRISVNESLYGKNYPENLPEGEYQLSYRKNGRGVYTFCMCPGGYVVASQSEECSIVTNGMSEYSRNGENSNSALAVSVSPDDYGKAPLDGVDFARSIEKKAYSRAKPYFAPACTVGSFLEGKASLKGASVTPSYSPGVTEADLNELFPKFVSDMMKEGLHVFARKMRAFGETGAVLTAPETRTSSPVRITRSESLVSPEADGLYPCGEGAGYAGGIMSAAVDGVKTAQAIMEKFKPYE